MKNFKIVTFLFLLLIIVPIFNSIYAATLKFDKATVSLSNGETFQIAVLVDPTGDSLNSVDSYVVYDSTVLKATTVTAGTLFPTVTYDQSSTPGKVYIAGLVNDPVNSISTSGTLATVTFQAIKDGTIALSFDCNSSKIIKNDINASNVINCSQNGTSAVTVGLSATPVPPKQLPKTGILENVVKFAMPGAILLILGSAFRLVL